MAEVEGKPADLVAPEPQTAATLDEDQVQDLPASGNSMLFAASLSDNGLSKRPRDARLLHMVLANLGVTAYHERVPLQLMDFAYRHTSSTLQDALHLSVEGFSNLGHAVGAGRGAGPHNPIDMSSVSIFSLRLSIDSRTHYQFSPTLPKDFYQEMAHERNRISLPAVGKDWGLRLPPEQHCLTGVGWSLKEEWENKGDFGKGQITLEQASEEYENEGEEGNDRMEDVFGEVLNDGVEGAKMDED